MDTLPSVLSIQVGILGHRTYAAKMREYFEGSTELALESYWMDEDREWFGRLMRRILNGAVPGSWFGERNLDFRRFRREIGNAYLARILVRRQFQKKQYDLLHFHTQVPALLASDLMKMVPTIVSGDMTSVQVAQENPNARFRFTYWPSIELERQIFTTAKHIVMWSEWAAQSVKNDYGVPPEKVSVVYPGVDLNAFRDMHRRSNPEKTVRILFVGNDFDRKGGNDLLDVFTKGLSKHAELHLVTNAPISCDHPRVHLHRGVSAYSPEWQKLYRQADIFVLPTHYEAFGLVFAEAMAASLPVVATNISAIPEIVSAEQSGILIQPNDRHALAKSIEALIDHTEIRCEMGTVGRQIVERKFDSHRNFQQLQYIFQKTTQLGN